MAVDIKGMRVTVIGFGRSGLSAAKLLYDKGAEVTITDVKPERELKSEIGKLGDRKVRLDFGSDGKASVDGAEILVVSPGVSNDMPAIQVAGEMGIRIISEVELFAWYCSSPIIAVTGTNGKTTTVTLIGDLLKNLGMDVAVAGNIGVPLTEVLGKLTKETIVVAEISSFQLEHIETFHPYISVVLNITPDHLDRYRIFRDYVDAKASVFANQTGKDWAILNACDEEKS